VIVIDLQRNIIQYPDMMVNVVKHQYSKQQKAGDCIGTT